MHPERKIKLVIADDHVMVRDGIKQVLMSNSAFSVVGELSNGDEAHSLLRGTPCDVLILDMSMPGITGIPLIISLKGKFPQLPIVIVSMHVDNELVQAAMKAGASAYVAKDSSSDVLMQAILTVEKGMKYLDPRLINAIFYEQGHESDQEDSLSAREMQVMTMYAQGMSLGDIADRLHVSAKTVSTHKKRIMVKLNISNNAALIRFAHERNMLVTEPDARSSAALAG